MAEINVRLSLHSRLKTITDRLTSARLLADQEQHKYDRSEHRWRRLYKHEKLENSVELLREVQRDLQAVRAQLDAAEREVLHRVLELNRQKALR